MVLPMRTPHGSDYPDYDGETLPISSTETDITEEPAPEEDSGSLEPTLGEGAELDQATVMVDEEADRLEVVVTEPEATSAHQSRTSPKPAR